MASLQESGAMDVVPVQIIPFPAVDVNPLQPVFDPIPNATFSASMIQPAGGAAPGRSDGISSAVQTWAAGEQPITASHGVFAFAYPLALGTYSPERLPAVFAVVPQ